MVESVLQQLLDANSSESVDKIIKNHPFFKACAWRFYGDIENNAGNIKGQSPDPVGALVEKITNGFDAILFKQAYLSGTSPDSPMAPKSQVEAVERFFGNDVANFNFNNAGLRKLALNSVRIFAEGEKDNFSLSIVDHGEGQRAEDFPKTFLSLSQSNKIKVHFAHGVFNQGGSAALNFCGNGYQLILSQRIPSSKQKYNWGFTLVRRRYESGYREPWYEYCQIDGKVPELSHGDPLVLPDGSELKNGSFIKLYSYDYPNAVYNITGQRSGELAREINERYLWMPLPIEVNEMRKQLPGWDEKKNQRATIYGLWRRLSRKYENRKDIKTKLSLDADLGIFGRRKIEVLIFDDQTEAGVTYQKQKDKLFLTVNGQTQHTENKSFLTISCKLPDLAPYMMVRIDLSDAGSQARQMFATNRIGLIKNKEALAFKNRLINSIKGDETLRKLNDEYQQRRLANSSSLDSEINERLAKIIKTNPEFQHIFGNGLKTTIDKPGNNKKEPFVGSFIPTFLTVKPDHFSLRPKGVLFVNLHTDAQNDYLDRDDFAGEVKWNHSDVFEISRYSLSGGRLKMLVQPRETADVGNSNTITVEMTRPDQPSLFVKFSVDIVSAVRSNTPPPSVRRHQQKNSNLPEFISVGRESWSQFGWNEQDIGVVEDDGRLKVYINRDAVVLTNFINTQPSFVSSQQKERIINKYNVSIAIYALSFYLDALRDKENTVERLEQIPDSLKSIAKVMLDLHFERVTSSDDFIDS